MIIIPSCHHHCPIINHYTSNFDVNGTDLIRAKRLFALVAPSPRVAPFPAPEPVAPGVNESRKVVEIATIGAWMNGWIDRWIDGLADLCACIYDIYDIFHVYQN